MALRKCQKVFRHKRKSRSDLLKRHALQRFNLRFDYKLSEYEYLQLCKRISNGDDGIVFIENQTNNISLWKLEFKNNVVIAVYNKRQRLISTFLTEDMI